MKNLLTRAGLEFRLASRNLRRHGRRSLQTLAVLVVGLTALTILDGYITFSMNGLQNLIIRSGTGDLEAEVSSAAFDEAENDPFAYLIDNTKAIAKELRRDPRVLDVLEAIPFLGVLGTGGKMETVEALALPTGQASAVLSARNITSGRDLTTEESGGVLVGSGLAEKLDLKPGSSVTLYALAAGGGVNQDTFTVRGIQSSGIAALDAVSVSLDLNDAQRLMGTTKSPQLLVFLEHHGDARVLQQKWSAVPPRSARGPLVWKRWDELSPLWQQASTSLLMVLGVARCIVLIVALFSITGTLTLSVLERLREIGTLRAFGTTRTGVAWLFLFEGMLLGLVGSILGVTFGEAVCNAVNLAGGLALPPQPGMSEAFAFLLTPDPGNLLQNATAVFFCSVLGALVPGAFATRRTTAELLRAL